MCQVVHWADIFSLNMVSSIQIILGMAIKPPSENPIDGVYAIQKLSQKEKDLPIQV